MNLIRRFARDRRGATAIEYCMIGGAVALSIVVALTTIGTKLDTTFGRVVTGLR